MEQTPISSGTQIIEKRYAKTIAIGDWDKVLDEIQDDEAKEYLQLRASGKNQEHALAKSNLSSSRLNACRQNASFRVLEASLATSSHMLTPELAKRRLKIKSLLIADQVIDDALNAKRPSDRTNAATLAFRAAGVVTPDGAGVNADLASATNAMAQLMARWSDARHKGPAQPVIEGQVIDTDAQVS